LTKTRVLLVELLYPRSYYVGAEDFAGILRRLTDSSPLRLRVVSAPSLTPDGEPAWADAVFVNDALLARPGAGTGS
jgi:hypothetical protein